VCARLPAVEQRHQPGFLIGPVAGEKPVPGKQLGVDKRGPFHRPRVLVTARTLRDSQDPVDRDRVDGRIYDPAGRGRGWGLLTVYSAFPLRRTWPVAVGGGIEDDVWQQTVVPLSGEERVEFKPGAWQVGGRQADRVERGVPAPLVRIESRCGPRDEASAVVSQGVSRSGGNR